MTGFWAEKLAGVVDGEWRLELPFVWTTRESTPRQRAYRGGGGSKQRQRSGDSLQTSHYHRQQYAEWVDRLVNLLPPEPVVVDLGCGDGRISELLRARGIRRLIAQDFNEDDLKRLAEDMDDESGEVLFVHASILQSPLLPGIADGVVMTEVSGTIEDPKGAYWACHSWLKPGGMALVSNVGVASYFVHALLNRDWEGIRSMVGHGVYSDLVGSNPVDLLLYTPTLMADHASDAGFEEVASGAIWGETGLLLHAMRNDHELTDRDRALVGEVDRRLRSIPGVYVNLLRSTR